MQMTALFGAAGNEDRFNKQYSSSLHAPAYLRELGLDLYEYQCGHGVQISEATARALGERARESGIEVSLHSPYYINLSSPEPEMREKGIIHILKSCRAVSAMGGSRIVVHCGGLKKMSRDEAMQYMAEGLDAALERMEQEGYGGITLCVETMGRINQLGTAEEVFSLCARDERLLPCIDFGHLNARTRGGMNSREDFARLLDEMTDRLGRARAEVFHAHFSKIEYTDSGEKRHLTFDDEIYGPEFGPLAAELARRGLRPHIICESAGTQAQDARALKDMYQAALAEQREAHE